MSDDLTATLNELSEAQVRMKLAAGEYGAKGTRFETVTHWLEAKRYEREDLFKAEQSRIARSARTTAIIALIVATASAISTIVSMIFTFLRRSH